MLEQLKAIDPAVLLDVVRQDQRSPAFEVTDWTVEHLSGKGIINPEGLFLFRGTGYDGQGALPWAVVLKALTRPPEEPDPRGLWNWRRELQAAQSGLLGRLPGPVQPARIYAAQERPEGGWLWMEHVVPKDGRSWGLDQYAFAAHEIGRFNGACLAAPPPDYPWLCTEHSRGWLATTDGFPLERAWENPYVRAAFPAALRARVERQRAERSAFLAALERPPRVFSHSDLNRRNLFIREGAGGADELVAVDWGLAGWGPLGGDLSELVGGTAMLFETDPREVSALEEVVTAAHLAGLREAGWAGDADLVRLGYAAVAALFHGDLLPVGTAAWTSGEAAALVRQFGRGPEEVAAGWAQLCAWGLDRGDEGRHLMDRLPPA